MVESYIVNQIEQYLWLGSVESRPLVTYLNAKVVLRVTTDSEAAEDLPEWTLPAGVREIIWRFADQESRIIDDKLQLAASIIMDCIERKETILVHCQAGISRSASLVLAHLIINRHMTAIDALKWLRARRPCVDPNRGFWRQLEEIESKTIEIDM